MSAFVIMDFETTGLSPRNGDRATEVAAAIVEDGEIIDRYQSLINPECGIPSYVQALTGITNDMVQSAPKSNLVMRDLHDFIEDMPLIAHNASFDKNFLDAEYSRAGLIRRSEFACSMRVARRIYPQFTSHKLGDLVAELGLPTAGTYHRAMADTEMTAHLFFNMLDELQTNHHVSSITHDFLIRIQAIPTKGLKTFLQHYK